MCLVKDSFLISMRKTAVSFYSYAHVLGTLFCFLNVLPIRFGFYLSRPRMVNNYIWSIIQSFDNVLIVSDSFYAYNNVHCNRRRLGLAFVSRISEKRDASLSRVTLHTTSLLTSCPLRDTARPLSFDPEVVRFPGKMVATRVRFSQRRHLILRIISRCV